MKRLIPILVSCIVFLNVTSAFSTTVISNDNLLMDQITISLQLSEVEFSVFQNASASNVTGVWFEYDGMTLTFGNINLDEGSDWYVVQPGDVFSKSNIAAGMFTPLVTFGPTSYPPATVGSGDFFLGVNTGIGFDMPDHRSVFGWVHLRPVGVFGARLTMVENAMSYDSSGIIVGTTKVVPEPASCALALATLCLAMSRRRG